MATSELGLQLGELGIGVLERSVPFQKGMDRLALLKNHPEILVPSKLRQMVGNPADIAVYNLKVTLGAKFDELYTPSVALLMVEENGLSEPTQTQESDGTTWAMALNAHRRRLILSGEIGEKDKALILFIAQHIYPDGAFIESYIQAESLRGQNLGRSFWEGADSVLRKSVLFKQLNPFYSPRGVLIRICFYILQKLIFIHPFIVIPYLRIKLKLTIIFAH